MGGSGIAFLRWWEACRIGRFFCVMAVRCGRLGWHETTSGVQLLVVVLARGEGIFLVEVFNPFKWLLYSGWVVATAAKVLFSSAILPLKDSPDEQMHLIQRAWLYGIASLQCLGWQLLVARYW